MLFIYEMKKIFKRLTPLFFVILLVAISATTIIITAIGFNQPTTVPDHAADYTALQNKIANWNEPRQEGMSVAWDNFYDHYQTLNSLVYGDNSSLEAEYKTTKNAFRSFYTKYRELVHQGTADEISDYLLVHQDYIDDLDGIMISLYSFFTEENKSANNIRSGLEINAQLGDTPLPEILKKIHVQKLDDPDLDELKDFLQNHIYSPAAYDYAHNKYLLSVAQTATFDGRLASYKGFADYKDNATCQNNMQLALYRLDNPDTDYSQPFAFGKIYNNGEQVSLMDFVFTNLEMAWIPILIMVIIWAACAFFTDVYQGTILTTLSAAKKRAKVIIAKTLAVFVLTVMTVLLFSVIYLVTGIMFFNAQVAPDVLFLFNKTTIATMSQINYFVIYLLGLLFKMLPFIAICGLFSFSKADPRVIVGCSLAVAVVVVLCNALLGGFWFYQFVPLLALDPIRYLGAQLFISPSPTSYNLWFTLPVMLVITIYLYWQLAHSFKKKDF